MDEAPAGHIPDGLNPTEEFVTRLTGRAAKIVQRAYGPAAWWLFAARAIGQLGFLVVFWLVSTHITSAAVPSYVTESWFPFIALAGATLSLANLPFEAARIRRVRRVLGAEPSHTALGPGEWVSQVYAAIWPITTMRDLVLTPMAIIWVIVAIVLLSAHPTPESGALTTFLAVVAVAMSLGVGLDIYQRSTKMRVAAGVVGPHEERPSISATDGFPVPDDSAVVAGEALMHWAAPVMRVQAKGTGFRWVVGWSGPSALVHDRQAQNTVLITDRALYLLCVLPSEQVAALGDSAVYDKVKMGLFYTGSRVREEIGRQLAAPGLASLIVSDRRNIRIPREQLTGLAWKGVRFTIMIGSGALDAFIFNHADAGQQFAADATRSGILVQPER